MSQSIDHDINVWGQTPASTARWYSREEQAWVVQLLDEAGNQIGAAEYISARNGGRDIAIQTERDLRSEYKLEN